MSWMKFYQPQDMDSGLPVVSAPVTAEPRGPIWYLVTNGTYTVQYHSAGSGNFVYDGSSLSSGTMDGFWVWTGGAPNDNNLSYAVGTDLDATAYIALAQAGNRIEAQEYLLSGTATYSGNDYISAWDTTGNNTINGYDGSDVIFGGAGMTRSLAARAWIRSMVAPETIPQGTPRRATSTIW